MTDFGFHLIHWYQAHHRDLPWRRTRNPYFIWLSEVILQQTRVEQGLEYYKRFVRTYPTIKSLAAAKEENILKLWQGLGYYSRARNLHAAARQVMKQHRGRFPKTYHEIRALKGVGDYTAAAVASFAYNLPYPVVDGNVFRLLSRYLGIRTPIDSSRARKEFTEAARLLMADADPHYFNQAIMEYGSRICRPLNPICHDCALQPSCMAYAKKWTARLPAKSKKVAVRNRYFHYFHIVNGKHTWMKKRGAKDIWENLYEFPLVEITSRRAARTILAEARRKKLLPAGTTVAGEPRQFRHILSHQVIHATFHYLRVEKSGLKLKGVQKIAHARLDLLPVHRLMEKYLETI